MPLLIETNLAQQKNSPDLSVARLNLSDTRMGPTAKMPTLKRELDIDAPPHEVWRVLTTPELVREWASVYLDGISIRTTWREGEAVTWKGPSGATHAKGTVAAFRPDRLLKFDGGSIDTGHGEQLSAFSSQPDQPCDAVWLTADR